MAPRRPNRGWALALAVAYALAGAAWGAARTPLGPAEARDLLAGRELLLRGAPAGPPQRLAAATAAAPSPAELGALARLAAWGERRGGLAAARLAVAALGIVAVALVFLAGDAPAWGGRGPLVAATFVLLGVPLQLVATVHPRVLAALLVALAIALAEEPERSDAGPRRSASRVLAAIAGAALAGAPLACAVAAPFAAALAVALVPSLALRDRTASAAFCAGAAAGLALAAATGLHPPWPELAHALWPFGRDALPVAPGQLAHVLDGLAMPLLLATFALFHRHGRARAAAAMAVSGAAFVVPFASAVIDDASTARLLAAVVLAPAAGVGVARMADVFAAGNPARHARAAFTAAVLVVVGVYGVHETRTLRAAAPDLRPAAEFLAADGAAGRTLLVDSDYGSPELVYRYYLGSATPAARVVPVVRADEAERREAIRSAGPDYVVLDAHHSDRSFSAASREYLAQGFAIAAEYDLALPEGARALVVLRRAR